MSGKVKHRTTANTVDAATISVNEKILRECHNLYTDAENGTLNRKLSYINSFAVGNIFAVNRKRFSCL